MGEAALVVGASGLGGGALVAEPRRQRLGVVGAHRNRPVAGGVHLDLGDPRELREVRDPVQPSIGYCPAAEPNVEFCDAHPAETWQANCMKETESGW